jgi:folate-binding protein YgfZ
VLAPLSSLISDAFGMTSWRAFLATRVAALEHDRVAGFPGDAPTAGAPLLVPLTHLAVTRFTGADAIAFLQGQLTCDVKGREPDSATLGAYCTPKGRMLATFIAVRGREAVDLVSAQDIAPALAKRLRMYVLRSKVTVEEAGDSVALLGLIGPTATALASVALGETVPSREWQAARFADGVTVARLPGDRLVLLVAAEQAVKLWDALVAAGVHPAPTTTWERCDVALGIPWVVAATQEQFIPQMANLELIGGVSFDKGCYPGQEVVARTHYRGEVKRRLRLARVEADPPPAPGDELYVGGTTDQTCGMVVNAVGSSEDGHDVLAVVQSSALAGEPVRLRAGDGPKLVFRDLPYAVP